MMRATSRSLHRLVTTCLLGALSVSACGHAQDISARPLTPDDNELSLGRLRARRGDHLGASRLLEAAWSEGADELEVLPDLLAAQMRCGRLRAARLTLDRLQDLLGPHQSLERLEALIEEIAPSENNSPHQDERSEP